MQKLCSGIFGALKRSSGSTYDMDETFRLCDQIDFLLIGYGLYDPYLEQEDQLFQLIKLLEADFESKQEVVQGSVDRLGLWLAIPRELQNAIRLSRIRSDHELALKGMQILYPLRYQRHPDELKPLVE